MDIKLLFYFGMNVLLDLRIKIKEVLILHFSSYDIYYIEESKEFIKIKMKMIKINEEERKRKR